MTFPKLSKVIDESQIKIEQKYLVKKFELILDRLKCVGCGQCSIVCPKDAILFGPAAAVYENKPKDLNAAVVDSVDETKCVYCGTCVVFCPFDAINVYEDGEKVKQENMDIIKFHSLPTLDAETVPGPNLGRDGKVYWEGEIEVKFKMPKDKTEFKQIYLNKCPGDCHKCDQICPTEAIKFREMEDAWESKILMEVDEEKCINCGACALVCPQDYYAVRWTKVKTKGPYNQIFWDPIKEKLLGQRVVFTPEE